MELIDLKRPKKKKGEDEKMPAMEGDGERYPYGLRITLEKEELDKLGIKPNDFDVGVTCSFQAEGKVEEISQRETTREDSERKSISIQITKMAIKGGKKGNAQGYNELQKSGPGGKA